jgi:hypothetical protein
MKLTKAEAELLLPIGGREFAGTDADLAEDVRNTFYVIDDAPWPYWEREKAMKVLANLAKKLGFALDDWQPVV